jgi:hypothetical protein
VGRFETRPRTSSVRKYFFVSGVNTIIVTARRKSGNGPSRNEGVGHAGIFAPNDAQSPGDLS